MKIRDEIKHFNKEWVYDNYTRIVPKFKEYEKISKVKMLDVIYEVYQDEQAIIDICTVRELKYLKKLIEGDQECQDRDKYFFEINNLMKKYLILSYPNCNIPEEIYDQVCSAIQKVDWKVAEEKTRINEVLVGACRIYGDLLLQPLLQIGSFLLGTSKQVIQEHMMYNRLFHFYTYFHVEDIPSVGEAPCFAYQDYLEDLDYLDEARKEHGLAHSKQIQIDDFINMFYYGFNINQKDVGKFYRELLKKPLYSILLDPIQETSLFQDDREPLIQFVKKFVGEDRKFINLMNRALDEMPSGALNGATPNEVKYAKLEEAKNTYKKEVNYVKQVNAKLSKKETKTFYQIYFALLEFTNQKYLVNSKLKKIYKQNGINPNELIGIIEKFWQNKEEVIDEFIQKNTYRFGNYELSLVREMKKGRHDLFVVASFEKEYTCLLGSDGKCYMIKGLNDHLDNILSYQDLPCMVMTTIMPFNEKIIYDGVIQEFPTIDFGSSFTTSVYNDLEKAERVYQL